jgi:hypothetical protein
MRDLNQAIYERLSGVEILGGAAAQAQSDLANALAPDGLSGRPAVFLGNMNDTAVVYPCVTFRPNAGVRDHLIGQTDPVDRVTTDFEIWNNARSLSTIVQIEDAMGRLLDERRGVCPPLTTDGYVFMGERIIPLSLAYAKDLRAWYGVLRYQFVVSGTGA